MRKGKDVSTCLLASLGNFLELFKNLGRVVEVQVCVL